MLPASFFERHLGLSTPRNPSTRTFLPNARYPPGTGGTGGRWEMLTLRLVHRSEAGDAHAADVSLDDGSAVERASSRFLFPLDAADREKVRWYLEDYPEFPLDPAPRSAARRSASGGAGPALFERVFAGAAAEAVGDA